MKENYIMNYDPIMGGIKGFYLKSIHGDNIPTPSIEITSEKHQFYLANNGKYKLNPVTLEDELLPISEPGIPQITDSERITMVEEAINMLMMM